MLWVADTHLIFMAIALLLVTSVAGGGRWLRHGMALAGAALAADALLHQRGLYVALAGSLLALVNLLAMLRSGSWSRTLDDEADGFHRRHLSRLTKAEARLLIDQGTFIEARAGEELTREGEPVESLHFLVRGVGAVLIDNAIVGRVGPGDLIGEACLLPDARASATVRLADDHCRLWFVPRDRLTAFLTAQPRIAAELNAATSSALRDKLERANRDRAEA